MTYRKKLIEVALPLEAINKASAREKSVRHGHPSTLHLWWARRPLAAARAVLFAQMVDDPSSHPEIFPTEADQNRERERLFRLIEDMVLWENTNNERVLENARKEIRKSWALTCKETGDDPNKLPAFHDPFAGGGSIPLEAQRLGLESYASDLNPVAVMINKAMIEIPPKFAGQPPVNPDARQNDKGLDMWQGAQGLADDVRYYGKMMRDKAESRIGHLYPKVTVTAEMTEKRPELKQYEGRELTVIAWLWARTVKSPNPAFGNVEVPLARSFKLCTKKGKEAWVKPVVENGTYHFEVMVGKFGLKADGTMNRRGGVCLISGVPIQHSYIREEAQAGRMGQRLMAVVCEGDRERVYISPTESMASVAESAKPEWKPEEELVGKCRVSVPLYGMNVFGDLFTRRQLEALTTFSDLITEIREQVIADAKAAGIPDDGKALNDGGNQAAAYGDALTVYLGINISRLSNRSSTICFWDTRGGNVQQVFARHAIPMTWDFAESNPFSDSTGNFLGQINYLTSTLEILGKKIFLGKALQQNATTQNLSSEKIVSTDPPYYDNISYADLSDYFYVWLRTALRKIFPALFATLTVPKAEELVASPYRHENREAAEAFFMNGMTQAIKQLYEHAHKEYPVSVYYAFKQSETRDGDTASTGWETFLEALIQSGFSITGTWPVRTEYTGNLQRNVNALASSIVIVCRKRPPDAPATARRYFMDALRAELPEALRNLQKGNIAPVDFEQCAIGPGMAVFSRYSSVLESDGTPVSVRSALAYINEVKDEILSEQEGELDPPSRWAVAWYEQYGNSEAPFGEAETLCTAKNISVQGLADAGIIHSKGGKVHLLTRKELRPFRAPEPGNPVSIWETAQQLVRSLEENGEEKTAIMLGKLRDTAYQSRDLVYRLYQICEKKGWAEEAFSYNVLIISWPEIIRLVPDPGKEQYKYDQDELGLE
jgi:putative DNA methylase